MSAPASTPPMSELPAGAFLHWLGHFRDSLLGNQGSDVPCGDCRGCCISGYSVQIRPHDGGARALIPTELLARVQGFARDELTMAARPDGTCPMLRANECSIYESRPQTCRDYDCRVFAASGISPDKAVIRQRVSRWRFSYPTELDRQAHAAVLATADFIRTRRSSFPNQQAPMGPSGISVLACESYRVFLQPNIRQKPDTEVARLILDESCDFHRSR